MKLRDIFAFRDPPESETSKPFLEHLEDLRWTIVKMAIVLIVAMWAVLRSVSGWSRSCNDR